MMKLRLELFVKDLESSIDFYRRVLNFVVERQDPEGYTSMRNGETLISLNRLDWLPEDHPIYIAKNKLLIELKTWQIMRFPPCFEPIF